MNEHYYTEKPTSPIKEIHFEEEIRGVRLKFTSVSGVFAHGSKVDKASQLLIKTFRPSFDKDSGKRNVLDMGCGYGPISLFLAALYPGLAVYGADINERAVAYARQNARANSLYGDFISSDLYTGLSERKYGDIVSNPPLAAGKALNERLIKEAFDHLWDGGALWLVAFHNKGGETLKKMMERVFGNAQDEEKKGGIRVYRSLKA